MSNSSKINKNTLFRAHIRNIHIILTAYDRQLHDKCGGYGNESHGFGREGPCHVCGFLCRVFYNDKTHGGQSGENGLLRTIGTRQREMQLGGKVLCENAHANTHTHFEINRRTSRPTPLTQVNKKANWQRQINLVMQSVYLGLSTRISTTESTETFLVNAVENHQPAAAPDQQKRLLVTSLCKTSEVLLKHPT